MKPKGIKGLKVIIPVAGIGTRLQPHTHTLPKPLLYIGGKTILDHLLEPLVELAPEEVIFVIGYKGEMIKQYVTRNYSFKATFIQQDKLLGLGYALHIAMPVVDGAPLLTILGDTIVECNLAKFIRAGDFALGLRQVDDPRRFGIAEIKEGLVVGLEEKPSRPKTNLALIGLYYIKDSGLLARELEKLVASGKKTRGEIQLTDALAGMLKTGVKFVPHEVQEWFDCGKKETMLSTNRHFLGKMNQNHEVPGSAIIPPVFIAEGVTIENSVVGPYVSVAEGTVIKRSIVSNSIIGERVRVENVSIEESVIGNNAILRGPRRIVNIGDSTEISSC